MKELAELVRSNPDAKEFDLKLGGDLWLTGDGSDSDAEATLSLLAPGRKLTLRGNDPNKPPTIWIPYDARHKASPRWMGLLLRGEEVSLRDLRIVLDAKIAGASMAAVVMQGRRQEVIRCQFVQYQPSFSESERLTSLLLDGTQPGPKPAVTLEECVFLGPHEFSIPAGDENEMREKPLPEAIALGGQDAVTIAGAANVKAVNCAFGPHGSVFAFEKGGQGAAKITVQHCTAIASSGDWSVFRFADGVACEPLEVQHCVFARPEGLDSMTTGMKELPRAVLVRQAGDGGVRYEGLGNWYYHLDGFWQRSSGDLIVKLDEFQHELARQSGKEERGRMLAAAPWAADRPLDLLQQHATAGNLRDLFRLKENLREADDSRNEVAGVVRGIWGDIYDKLPEHDLTKPAATAKQLVVDPNFKGSAEGVFRKLSAALEEASPGDVVLIKHDGLLAVNLARLEKASTRVTIRPYPEHHPILTMDKTPDTDAALFTVHDGEVTLEGLEFLLQPGDDRFQAQAIVKLVQDGACTFKDCVITLKEPRRASLAVVTLTDPSGAMKMDKDKPEIRPDRASDPSARVKFENCFVRGEGDLVWVRSSRPFDLDCSKSLVAVSGSLLNVEAGRDDAPAVATSATANVKLSRLTAYLGGYLVRLKAGRELKSLVPVHCKPIADCLFVAADKKSTLIHLDGPSANEEKMRNLVQWEGGKNNNYSNFDRMLDQQPPENSMEMSDAPYGQDKWKAFTGESDGRFGSVRFAEAPPLDKLPQATPGNFKVYDADMQSVGAEVDKLPPPGDQGRTDSGEE
jgi:hypothetical protein